MACKTKKKPKKVQMFCDGCDRCLSCGKPVTEHGCPKPCTLPHYPTVWPYYGWPYWYVPAVVQPNVTISQPSITWGTGTVYNGTIAGANNNANGTTYLLTSGTDVSH